ncbi:MAG: tRNA (adenosine(37)-N6)-threonylcarbamoyltransferase complex transferase subunit TsaD [Cryomorphaceae bacterium]|nr:tRNA (adenosine(37)-N6)-threonylcarbamoyltransferase complex transferase subunit TsaD [Cryomorphaceae bacterium]
MDGQKYILGIESSCDDTSAAVLVDRRVLSNVTANQDIHREYGGVVPELASRAHQENIVPVIDQALKKAGITANQLDGIAYTKGPGLLGALLVGGAFAKSMAQSLDIPLYDVHHMRAHILAHMIENVDSRNPEFPFLCLTVSGGHTQIVRVDSPYDFVLLGQTIDDAAGEAFDKAAKIMGLPYPGGPLIDKYAKSGNPNAFTFGRPNIPDLNFSFSGLKTSFLYTVQNNQQKDSDFVTKNLNDLAASIQFTIVDILMEKLERAVEKTGIDHIAIAGGVSANSELRNRIVSFGKKHGKQTYIPPFSYCTDNGAMIGIVGWYNHQRGLSGKLDEGSLARWEI